MSHPSSHPSSAGSLAAVVLLVAVMVSPVGMGLGLERDAQAIRVMDGPAFGAGTLPVLAADANLAFVGPLSEEAQEIVAADAWLDQAAEPAAVVTALAAFPDKVPVEFNARLKYALPDGTLRVMVHLAERNAEHEAFVAANTVNLLWYGETENLIATIRPDQLPTLLAAPVVMFVEPDFILTSFMAQSTIDVNARTSTGTGNGVWYWDGTTGTFKSDISGLTTAITGSTVTAAIIDSGIDGTHKDFSGTACTPSDPMAACDSRIKLKVKAESVSGQLVQLYPSDALPTTDLASGHGTHVSGTVAGNGWYSRNGHTGAGGDGKNFGVAPEASLVVVTNGDSQWAGLANWALQWVLANHATYGIKVTSNSWGCLGGCAYDPNSVTSDLVHDLYLQGIVTVFAVGNDAGTGSGNEFSGYAQSPYVIGVAAYDRSHKVASFSSRGQSSTSNTLPAFASWTPGGATAANERRADIAAPGVDIVSARSLTGGSSSIIPRVNTRDVSTLTGSGIFPYAVMSGTSMATPHVTGAVVLLFDACPAATPLEVMRAIFAGADASAITKTGSSATADPFEVGYGQLDVRASLDWLRGQLTSC